MQTSDALETSTVSLCSMRVGDEVFGIDTQRVQEVLGESVVHSVPLAPEFVGGVLPYRGEVLLILSFRKLLGMPPLGRPESVLVLRDDEDGELFGIAVDAVESVIAVSSREFADNPCTLDARRKAIFAGAYKLQDSVVVRLEPDLLRPMRLLETLTSESSARTMGRDACAF